MTPANGLYGRYLDRIRALPPGALSREGLLGGRFRLHHEPTFSIHYAPFDYIHRPAKVALVGISPGWQQMEIAFRVARAQLARGASAESAARAVKDQASFAGMRNRLSGWLDELELHDRLAVASSAELFGGARRLLHTTSAVRYPVIRADGDNWSGSRPSPTTSPVLRRYLHELLAPELAEVPDALIVPLGSAVAGAMRELITSAELDERRVLLGFPHPSGLNTRGPRVFAEQRSALRRQIRAWFADDRRSAKHGRSVGTPSPTSRAVPQHAARSRDGDGARSQPVTRSPRRRAPADGHGADGSGAARPRSRSAAKAVSTRSSAPASARSSTSSSASLPGRDVFQALILAALDSLGALAARQDIKDRAIELGRFTEAQLRVPPPSSKVGQYPGQVAYQLDWAMNALKSAGHIRSPQRTIWELTAAGRRRAR